MSAQDDLVRALERGRRLQQERAGAPALDAALTRVASWQAQRLRTTYQDLEASPRYAAAIIFFQTDLYGPGSFSQRDANLARVVPLMVRLLPASVVATVAHAMELSALSHELDRALASELGAAELTAAAYCEAYRACGRRSERELQIGLVASVGAALDRYVGKPMIRASLSLMRRPAQAAGLGALQAFLERGFDAFSRMGGAEAFLAVIDQRERALMEAIFAGKDDPFGAAAAAGPKRP